MVVKYRRRFIGMALCATAAGSLAEETAGAQPTSGNAASPPGTATSITAPVYLVVYRRGPGWIEGRQMREQQGMREHFRYYLELHRAGRLRAGGGFTDGSGGAAIFEASDDAAAAAFVAADPAVLAGVFQYELKQWRPNPWEEISRKAAARGE